MKPYRTNLREAPQVGGLSPEEGWVNMQVQFLIDEKSAGSGKLLVGWTVLPPGARHEKHRHPRADEFLIVIKGHGWVYTDSDDETAGEGDVIFTPRGHWHGFNNNSDQDVVLAWGWSGAGSLEAAGYELPPDAH